MKIEQIFKKLGKEIISIKDSSKGVDQTVKIVTCKDDTYVYKEPKKELDKILYEVKGSQIAKKFNIPAPETIKKTKKYLIQTYIPGKEISKGRPTRKVYEELGRYIQLLHTKKAPQVGKITCKEKINEIKLIDNLIKKHLKGIQKYLPKHKEDIEQYFEKNKTLLEDVPIVYCHSDLTTDNIKVNKGKISGIIDWADLYGSYPEYDIGTLYVDRLGDKHFEAFIKGYGPCDFELIKLAAAVRLTWMLEGDFDRKRTNTKLFKDRLKLYLDIIKDI